jgi:hypothetical protein
MSATKSLPLLSISADAKTVKGEKKGFLTAILYLAPADESVSSGGFNTCPKASEGCKAGCLFTAGRSAIFPKINLARIRKTVELKNNRAEFLAQLARDIRGLIRKAKRENLIPCVRVNGTSDLPFLAHAMAELFPNVQFYDYTKLPHPWTRIRANYCLTFSHAENNLADCLDSLAHGVNVAVVFGTKKGEPLPETWHGFKVVSGDESDLRFLDSQGVVIGLYAKGKAKQDATGFVERQGLVSILPVAKVSPVLGSLRSWAMRVN